MDKYHSKVEELNLLCDRFKSFTSVVISNNNYWLNATWNDIKTVIEELRVIRKSSVQ